MKRIEDEIKDYYLKSFEHQSQLQQIKNRTSFFEKKKHSNKGFSRFLYATSLIGLATVFIVVLSINLPSSSSKNVISPISKRIKNSIVQIDSTPLIVFTTDDEGNVSSIYGSNLEGKMIIAGEDLIDKSYENVLETIFEKEKKCGYLLNEKYNHFKLNIYAEDEYQVDELKNSISDYFSNESINFKDDINISSFMYDNFEIDKDNNSFLPSRKCEEYEGNNFLEFYNYLKDYYLFENKILNEGLEDYSVECYVYHQKLAYYETINDKENDIIKNELDILRSQINTYLNTYYNSFVNQNSSYQMIYNELIEEKIDLVKHRVDDDFNYQEKEESINQKLVSLKTYKEFMINSMKQKMERIDDKFDKISKKVEGKEFDNDLFLEKEKKIKTEFESKFSNDVSNNKIKKMKEELINYFKK